MNFVEKGKPPAAPAGRLFLAKQQLLKTSSPDITNGAGMETETVSNGSERPWNVTFISEAKDVS